MSPQLRLEDLLKSQTTWQPVDLSNQDSKSCCIYRSHHSHFPAFLTARGLICGELQSLHPNFLLEDNRPTWHHPSLSTEPSPMQAASSVAFSGICSLNGGYPEDW